MRESLRWVAARVERRALDSLRPGARNPRVHDDRQIAKLAASLRRFGWTRPILIEPSGEIVAGVAVWRAAKSLGLGEAPVVVADHLTPAEVEAYRIADYRLALDARWDDDVLAAVLRDLAAVEIDASLLGFDARELAKLLPKIPREGASDPDEAPPPPATPITRPGDVWIMGEHRLICGDSTRAETLAALMDDAAGLVFTDPPYGMGYDNNRKLVDVVVTDPPYGMSYDGGRARKADIVVTDPPYGMRFGAGKAASSSKKGAKVKAHGMILGDDVRGSALVGLVAAALATARAWAKDDAPFYICLTWRTYAEFLVALERAGLALAASIVWDKGSIGLGYQHYRPRHEFVFYCKGAWYGPASEGDVWALTRGATGEYVHPTQKPVALIERALANSSRPGDVVLDGFGGSGSTLIAAERMGRRARLVELDAKFCDAIARRWEKFTGRTAARVSPARAAPAAAPPRADRPA